MKVTAISPSCFHCGTSCETQSIYIDEKIFCCMGCKTVYELLREKNLCDYYSFEQNPGNQLRHLIKDKFQYLESDQITSRLLDFQSKEYAKVTFHIPSIHCSSCIWLLENLSRFDQGIIQSKINFRQKYLSVDFHPTKTNLKNITSLLYQLGYEPDISLQPQKKVNINTKSKYLKIGVAGFCFGNIMLLAFPDYIGLSRDSVFIPYFSYISLLLSLPVLFYCSSAFFASAWGGLSKKVLNIDLPIVIGTLTLFFRSLYDIFHQIGPGYLDSLAGLIFFLLIGRWLQDKTYQGLSFDRNFKSYFPLAVMRITQGKSKPVLVEHLEVNNLIVIRNEEIIPCDTIMIDNHAQINYSFVTGESEPIQAHAGDKLYAGGKIIGISVRMRVIKQVSQSYLTQLWNNPVFDTKTTQEVTLVDQISKYFTPALLVIAIFSGLGWAMVSVERAFFIVSSILIIACPCALALTTPFTLSTTMNILGKKNMYLKGTQVIEQIWKVKKIVFDKTGTIATTQQQTLNWHGTPLPQEDQQMIVALVSQSTHPLSQQIAHWIHQEHTTALSINFYKEVKNLGITGKINNHIWRIGAAKWVNAIPTPVSGSQVFIKKNHQILGWLEIKSVYRKGLREMILGLSKKYKLALLSGDNDSERSTLSHIFPNTATLSFGLNPTQKLAHINRYEADHKTMMIGDGLNDAGALQAAYVGVSITENMSSFTPASDIILRADQLTNLPKFLAFIHASKCILKSGFALSFFYNILGIGAAIMGYITPIYAAILMPLSSISVVVLATFGIYLIAYKIKI